jgi:tellurite resistance protein
MSHVRSFFRPLAVALTVAFVAAPLTAFAGTTGAAPAGTKTEAREKHKAHFPMPGATFEQKVDKRIEKARARLEKHMGKANVPDAKRAEARKRFDEGATQLRAAAKRAAADGTVTAEEAKEVRKVARSLAPEGKKGKHHKRDGKAGKAA